MNDTSNINKLAKSYILHCTSTTIDYNTFIDTTIENKTFISNLSSQELLLMSDIVKKFCEFTKGN